MDLGHWIYPYEFDTKDWFGFIYRITEIDTGKEYIGKKQFVNRTRKIIKNRKNRKVVKRESNWREYTGSSEELNSMIASKGKDNYRFDIISLHATKGSLYYAEVERQIHENVLRERLPNKPSEKKYYNKFIAAVKFVPPEETLLETQMNTIKMSVDRTKIINNWNPYDDKFDFS